MKFNIRQISVLLYHFAFIDKFDSCIYLMFEFHMSEFKNLSNQDAVFFSSSTFDVYVYMLIVIKTNS